MGLTNIRIVDVLNNEYSEFLNFCAMNGKVYTHKISIFDYVVFRNQFVKTGEYVS